MNQTELERPACGKVFTTNFKRFRNTWELVPNAMWFGVTRYPMWKRGKGPDANWRRTIIAWMPELAPSRELLKKKKRGEIEWVDFITCYLEEIQSNPKSLRLLQEIAHCVAAGRDVVLMCFENKGEKCHRYELAELLYKLVRQKQSELYGCMYRLGSPKGGELCVSLPHQEG